jgi:hypothetical protein
MVLVNIMEELQQTLFSGAVIGTMALMLGLLLCPWATLLRARPRTSAFVAVSKEVSQRCALFERLEKFRKKKN